jgi:SPX domain protein involved in polyphosphate accumulation
MIKENPEEGPSCTIVGRWYRDPSLPVHRTEVTRFPHAILEMKLTLREDEAAPEWLQELVESGRSSATFDCGCNLASAGG